jgi:hypothetical protein
MPQKTPASSGRRSGEEGSIGGQQIRHQLASHGQRSSIGVTFLRGLVMDRAQLLMILHADFGRFDEHRLQVPITLLGQRSAFLLARRFTQRARQTRSNPPPV